MIRCKYIFMLILTTLLFSACVVKDDIPFPIVEAAITAFEVDGQCDELDENYAEAKIDKAKRLVEVYVGDTVNLSRLTIKRFEVSNEAKIIPQDGICINPSRFPSISFWRTTGDTSSKVNFSNGTANFTLHTYQDYEWEVRVRQVIIREVQMAGQVGEAVIDPVNRNVIVYVSSRYNLNSIKVGKFSLGGQHGSVSPDPTQSETYDFSQSPTFQVRTAGSNEVQAWRVFVYLTDAQETAEATSFARSTSVAISGTIPMGSVPTVEYRAENVSEWTAVNPEQVSVNGTRFTAEISGLRPGTTYIYRVKAGDVVSEEKTFTTVDEQQLDNSSFDEWSISGEGTKALYQPWGEGQSKYWDTGNRGATTVGASNSTYADEGSRRFANLQSKYIVIKFAAGNIFTGDYVETDGSNGVLSFGRPFTSFPTKMRFEYKYKTSTINRTGGEWKSAYGDYISKELYEGLKGQPDSCNIYIALGDWEPVTYVSENSGKSTVCPYLIRTKPSALHLFNTKDDHLIAFGQMTKGENVDTWTTETLTINYRIKNRQPKYIIVVASSSKYGDYFTGGESSLLQLDNIELLYD